jgi:hypothetical protein
VTTPDSGETPDSESDLPPTHQPYGQQPADPYGAPPPSQSPYGPPPGQSPYGAPQGPQSPPAYGAPQYGQQLPHPQQPPGVPGYGYAAAPPSNHPSATTALVLSLVGLAGLVFCGGLTLVLSPFAWRLGSRAVAEIDANPGAYGGRDQANAGRIMGIIGTVLLGLGILLLIGLIGLVAVGSSSGTVNG